MPGCVFVILTSLLSFVVYLGIMVHLKSLNSQDWEWQINSMQGDLKLLMQKLNSNSFGNKPEMAGSSQNLNSDVTTVNYETAVEDIVNKHMLNMKSDIEELRKRVSQLLCKNKAFSSDPSCEAELINLATDTLGTKIVYIDDQPLNCAYTVLSFFGIKTIVNTPREILNNDMQLGKCYAFKGSTSIVVIKLQKSVIVSSVSIEHIIENETPYGNNTNAPRKFEVHGLPDLSDVSCKGNCEHCFGEFEYKIESKQPVQIFKVSNTDPPCPFKYIQFSFLTNHGHPNHTCVYRIGVYGKVLE